MALHKLLDASSFRRLQVIERLASDDSWWTLGQLAQELACSRRTLIVDIQMINNNENNHFFIHTSKQRGIKLKALDTFHMEDVYQDLINTSLNFQIIRTVIELDTVSIEDLAEWLYTSRSSINRSLKQLNDFLAEYDLCIQTAPLKISGKEIQIRYFYSVFLCEYYSADKNHFDHPMKKEVSQFLLRLEKEAILSPPSFMTYHRTLMWLLVCADRVQKGHKIEKNYQTPDAIDQEIKQRFLEMKKHLPFDLPEKELNFMFFIYWNNHRKFDEWDIARTDRLNPVYQDIVRFLDQIKKETTYSIENQSLMATNLMRYLFYRNFFKGPSYIVFNPSEKFIENSLKLFKEFIEEVEKIIDCYSKENWIKKVPFEEFIFMLMLFWKGISRQIIAQKEKIQVLISSYIGIHQEVFLADVLEARFPTMVECYVASNQTYNPKRIQLVLTDYKIDWTKALMSPAKKIMGISIVPTKREWKRIEHMIKKIQTNQ